MKDNNGLTNDAHEATPAKNGIHSEDYVTSKFVYVRVHNLIGVRMLLKDCVVRHGTTITDPAKYIAPHGMDDGQTYREVGADKADVSLYYTLQDVRNSLVNLDFNWQGTIKGIVANAPGLKVTWTSRRDKPYGSNDLYIDYYLEKE